MAENGKNNQNGREWQRIVEKARMIENVREKQNGRECQRKLE